MTAPGPVRARPPAGPPPRGPERSVKRAGMLVEDGRLVDPPPAP
ncbi:hypothetical protein [Streptomyces sp. NPDC091371]